MAERVTPYTGKPFVDKLMHDSAKVIRRVVDPYGPVGAVEAHARRALMLKLGIDIQDNLAAVEHYHNIPEVRPARQIPRLLMERIADATLDLEVNGFENYREAKKLNAEGHPVIIDGNHLTLMDMWPLRRAVAREGHIETDRNTVAIVGRIENNPFAQIFLSSTPRIYVPQPEDSSYSSQLVRAFRRGIIPVLRNPNLMLYVNHEGTRSRTKGLGEPKEGVENMFTLADNMVVLPVAVEGMEKVMPIGSPFPKPGKVKLTFGEPIDISEFSRYTGKGGKVMLREKFEELVVKRGLVPLLSPQYRGVYR